jgi:hypothetical protein
MTDKFLTRGLEMDRYLKAIQLTDRFETEVEAALADVGDRMIAIQPDLFASSVQGDVLSRRDTSILAFSRINYPMTRVQSRDSNEQLQLNVHLYWRDPAQCNRRDIDGALRQFGYKIKGLATEVDDRLAEQTERLGTAGNPYDSNTCFYRHVDSAEDIDVATDELVNHFERFGDECGVEPAGE